MFGTISIFLLFVILLNIHVSHEKNGKSRMKRYIAFPEGSTLSIAICMTAQTGLLPGEIFTEGVNWGISYELPNDTKPFKNLFQNPNKAMRRRHRRDIYKKVENIMSSMGYDGRSCILRALCEASRNFKANGDDLLNEVLRIFFAYTTDYGVLEDDYNVAAIKGTAQTERECFEMYTDCPFSLIDLAQGYYSSLYT